MGHMIWPIWKSSLSRSQKSESEVSNINPRFLKIPEGLQAEGPKMDQKSKFDLLFEFSDLWWPCDPFSELWRQERHFDVYLPVLRKIYPKWPQNLKFDQNDFYSKIILTSHWSFWAIISKKRYNLWFLIKKSQLEIVR